MRRFVKVCVSLVAIWAVFVPSAAGACNTEEYTYDVTRTGTKRDPAEVTLADGASVSYNYTAIVDQGPERRTTLPTPANLVPGSTSVDRYYWEQARYGWVWKPNMVDEGSNHWHSNIVDEGSNHWHSNMVWVDTSYDVPVYENRTYSELVTHTYTWSSSHYTANVHRCWYDWGTAAGHDHFHSLEEGYCPPGHGPGYQSHANRQEWQHVEYGSGSYQVYEERCCTQVLVGYQRIPSGYLEDRGSWHWHPNVVDRGSWHWHPNVVDRGSNVWEIVGWDPVSSASAPASSGDVRKVTFDARWKVYEQRLSVPTDPRPGVPHVPESLTFDYTETLIGCVEPA